MTPLGHAKKLVLEATVSPQKTHPDTVLTRFPIFGPLANPSPSYFRPHHMFPIYRIALFPKMTRGSHELFLVPLGFARARYATAGTLL